MGAGLPRSVRHSISFRRDKQILFRVQCSDIAFFLLFICAKVRSPQRPPPEAFIYCLHSVCFVMSSEPDFQSISL